MFLIFDTETTGLPKNYNAPLTDFDNWPRMVQLAWQVHDAHGRALHVLHVELPGSALIRLMDDVATYGPQCVSGVKMVIADKKVESLEVGGKPVDPKKKYGVATVDFLLDGGDNISVARGASKLIITDVIIGKAIEQYVRNLTAEGKAIEYQTDGRVVVK